jgi:hypothetical protein
MDIAGIWQSLRGAAPSEVASQAEKSTEALAPPRSERNAATLSPEAQEKLRDILARYDVTNISPRDFSQLIAELKESGAIGDADQEVLAQVRLELDRGGLDPDELVDLTQILEQKLQTQERDLRRQEEKQGAPIDRSAALHETLRQIDWISKFALLHRAGDYQPLNAVA